MRTLIIAANFHVDIAQGADGAGNEKPPIRKPYTKGMVVDEADLPEGHTADAWIAKELAAEAPDQA